MSIRDTLNAASVEVVGFWPRWKRGVGAPGTQAERDAEIARLDDATLLASYAARLRGLELAAREAWLVKGLNGLSVVASALEAARRALAAHGGPHFDEITDDEARSHFL